jgi:hypothetical protein
VPARTGSGGRNTVCHPENYGQRAGMGQKETDKITTEPVFLYDLKGQCHEIFDFWFFHGSVSPKPISIPIGSFRIFSKIRGDIRCSRFASGVNDTGGKCKKSSIIKVSII